MSLSFTDLAVSFGINIAFVAIFLLAYAILSTQPVNARVFFTKWFCIDDKKAAEEREKVEMEGQLVAKKQRIELSWRKYVASFNWVKVALDMPERELIDHAGLDAAVYLRTFKLGFKIFGPIFCVAAVALFPIYYTAKGLSTSDLSYSSVETISISNIPDHSTTMWAPLVFAWLFNLWALYLLRKEYKAVSQMRLSYLAHQKRAPNQFTVLVRQVPPDPIETVLQKVEHFFSVVHADHYLLTQPVYNANKLARLDSRREWIQNRLTFNSIRLEKNPAVRPSHKIGLLGCFGEQVDSLNYYEAQHREVIAQIAEERERVTSDASNVMPAAFVSFRTRWAAAVAAQTQQSRDCTQWITLWAPETRDVVWANLSVNFLSLNARMVAVGAAVVAVILFYTVPVSFVQSLTNLDNLVKTFPWLEPVVNLPFINAILQAVLPSLAFKLFIAILPYLLYFFSMIEGYVAWSYVERATAGKFFYFMIATVFFSNVIAGSLISQVQNIANNPSELPSLLGNAIPAKSSFFITWTMLDGWAAVAAEVLQLLPLLLFHLKNQFLVRTPADRQKAMNPQGFPYFTALPQTELYFLLPFVYCVIAPLYLPFALVYFIGAYIVYRNQFINVYDAQYEMAGGYWPHFHARVIAAMVIQQITLFGVFALKGATIQSILVIPLLVVTVVYHIVFINAPFRANFDKLALEEANRKDTIDRVLYPEDNPRAFLARAYLHPSLKAAIQLDEEEGDGKPGGGMLAPHERGGSAALVGPGGVKLVAVKRLPRSAQASPAPSDKGGEGVRKDVPISASTDPLIESEGEGRPAML